MIRFLQGAASPTEEQRLGEWRRADPANERRFRATQELWILTGLGAGVAEETPNPAALLRRGDQTTSAPPQPVQAPPSPASRRRALVPRRRVWRGALAAGLAAIAFGAAYLGLSRLNDDAPTLVHDVATGSNQRTTVLLSDGSSVRLGPNSRIRVRQSPNRQRVELTGRAFFAAESTPTRTLVVATEVGQVVTLGTRFEVRAEEGQFRVLVVDGRVAVSVADQDVEVGRGEMTRAVADRLAKSKVEDVYGELNWMGNHLAFKATPLEAAVHEIRERFGVPVRIQAAELKDFPVTATFTDQPVAVVLRVLCELAQATCPSTPDGIQIGE